MYARLSVYNYIIEQRFVDKARTTDALENKPHFAFTGLIYVHKLNFDPGFWFLIVVFSSNFPQG